MLVIIPLILLFHTILMVLFCYFLFVFKHAWGETIRCSLYYYYYYYYYYYIYTHIFFYCIVICLYFCLLSFVLSFNIYMPEAKLFFDFLFVLISVRFLLLWFYSFLLMLCSFSCIFLFFWKTIMLLIISILTTDRKHRGVRIE